MTSWLICVFLSQVSEKTDGYMDNLRLGLELWEKQLVLGGEVDSWTSTKLIIFSESHPFSSETEILSMKVFLHKMLHRHLKYTYTSHTWTKRHKTIVLT